MLLGQLVQEDGTQIDIEDVEKLHDPQTARTKDHVEKLFIEKERNVIGIATEVVGDGRLLKKIKSSLKNNCSISTDKELQSGNLFYAGSAKHRLSLADHVATKLEETRRQQ